jgi:isopentenyl diphosphate isomerase/L-lactate dehydrogenase-like FMN-dependent dehydrogenase
LRAQELIIINTTSTQSAVTEAVVSFQVSIAESVRPPLPHLVANQSSPRILRTPPVPTSVTRVVAVYEPIQFFLLAAATPLREACDRQCGQQKKTRDH